MPSEEMLNEGPIIAVGEVGRRFEEAEYFIPEMLAAARAMKAGSQMLCPLSVAEKVGPLGRLIFAAVQGEFHDTGKNLVGRCHIRHTPPKLWSQWNLASAVSRWSSVTSEEPSWVDLKVLDRHRLDRVSQFEAEDL